MVRTITLTLAFFLPLISACSSEKAKLRNIPGHVADLKGVAHGHGGQRAERYCSQCHGLTLAGGEEGQPPCLKCHGVRWQETGPTELGAPRDTHTLLLGGFLHHTAINSVQGTCTSCHGSDLQGLGAASPPGCFLCHDQLWIQ